MVSTRQRHIDDYDSSTFFGELLFSRRNQTPDLISTREIWLCTAECFKSCPTEFPVYCMVFGGECPVYSFLFPVYSFIGTLLWPDYLRNVLSARGPYTRRKLSGSSCELLSTDMKLIPEGAPCSSQFWIKQPKSDVKDYNSFALKISGRAVAQYSALLFKFPLR